MDPAEKIGGFHSVTVLCEARAWSLPTEVIDFSKNWDIEPQSGEGAK